MLQFLARNLCYSIFNSPSSPCGPVLCFIFFATSTLFFMLGPAVRCVGGARPPGALACVYFRFFSHFFATSTLILILGLYFASFLSANCLFYNAKCALSSLRSRWPSRFLRHVYVNIRLGPLFCFIFKAETYVFQYKMRLPLPAVPCVVLKPIKINIKCLKSY